MSAPSSALDQSAFFVPFIDSHRLSQCKKTYEMMVERGMESWTMAGRAVSWAEDQDPLGHVKASAYLPYITNCAIRLMESFQGQLGDKYPDFISGKGKGFLSNKSELKINRVAKYPDMLIVGLRIQEVHHDRIAVGYQIWSSAQQILIAEMLAWTVFFDYKSKKTLNLLENGQEFSNLYSTLVDRKARSDDAFNEWKKKQEVSHVNLRKDRQRDQKI
ncbi:hypothetical protein N7450_010947 [Penicillium hetheringtonii]|uniref:Uncharacterized protein n=1 Tax=Penicillium hetheringtonii TaxID=911720 RepID=A0AAD6GKH7_9EURO|nr:hypothetical protein N7450_010947 [Penicillium hetheringtonii]